MSSLAWFARELTFGKPAELLPFFLERLSGTPVRIDHKVKGFAEDQLGTRLDGKWSVKEHIGHLAEVDQIANRRIDEMLAGKEVMSPAVFEPQDYTSWPVLQVIDFFADGRQKNIGKYESIAKEKLLSHSLHPRLKLDMTPVDLAWFDAEHDDHHLLKMSEIIGKLRSISQLDNGQGTTLPIK
ncbi:MAG: DinB family protein [Bacteroidetes bacterium]|nr:DinB family protein [Bacteroidota bacterium]MBS1978164.1 DinB family protein [Bacteroidota bacterium]